MKKQSSLIGQSVPRVDAYDKVTGRAKFTADRFPKNCLVAKVLHATIANGLVKQIDTAKASTLPGVVKIVTCFDVPDLPFATSGNPWTLDPAWQDIADRKLLNQRVRYYGDDIAAVVAIDEAMARQALRLIQVEYEEYPAVFTPKEASSPARSPCIRNARITFWAATAARTGIRRGNPGARSDLYRQMVSRTAGQALSHGEPRLLRLYGASEGHRRRQHADGPRAAAGHCAGAWPSLGAGPGDQALGRRWLRQ